VLNSLPRHENIPRA